MRMKLLTISCQVLPYSPIVGFPALLEEEDNEFQLKC